MYSNLGRVPSINLVENMDPIDGDINLEREIINTYYPRPTPEQGGTTGNNVYYSSGIAAGEPNPSTPVSSTDVPITTAIEVAGMDIRKLAIYGGVAVVGLGLVAWLLKS